MLSTLRIKKETDKAKAARKENESEWARVEVRAPYAGVVLERNVAPHDIVDTLTDLFKIGRLDQLLVYCNAYEESLPGLLSLPPEKRCWKVRLSKPDPQVGELDGAIERIRDILDPTTQTVFVVGRVNNPDGRLKAGQFVTATVPMPAPPGTVTI